jgi:hypothetical protein
MRPSISDASVSSFSLADVEVRFFVDVGTAPLLQIAIVASILPNAITDYCVLSNVNVPIA